MVKHKLILRHYLLLLSNSIIDSRQLFYLLIEVSLAFFIYFFILIRNTFFFALVFLSLYHFLNLRLCQLNSFNWNHFLRILFIYSFFLVWVNLVYFKGIFSFFLFLKSLNILHWVGFLPCQTRCCRFVLVCPTVYSRISLPFNFLEFNSLCFSFQILLGWFSSLIVLINLFLIILDFILILDWITFHLPNLTMGFFIS